MHGKIKIKYMAKKIWDEKIGIGTDWGGDESTNNLPVAGNRVQELIKDQLKRKAGAFLFDEDRNSYLVFADAEDEAKYIQSGGDLVELIISEIKMTDPGVYFKATTLSPTSFAVSENSNVLIKFTWSSIDKDEQSTGNGTVIITVAGRTVYTGFIPQGENNIDISKYLIVGDNNVRLVITDSYDNRRVMTYTVNLVSLRISSSYDPSTINEGEITFRYTPIGSILKTAHFIINEVEVVTREIPTSGNQITQLLPAQAHGAHSLRVYLSANIGGSEVRSNELYYDIISIEDGRTETLIASTFDTAKMIEYETLNIPYVVYNPLSNNSSVQLKVDGEVLQDVIVDRRLQTWSYKAMGSGTKVLEIISNGVSKTISLTVTESEVNVRPEEGDLKLFLTSQNRSNQQLNKEKWEFDTIKAQLTGFDFATNGWIRDSEGSMALKVSNEAKVVIPYKMFATEFRNSGKTIEFEFMATEMKNSDVPLISSIYGDITEEVVNGELQTIDRRIGFEISPQKAYFGSEQTFITTNFKENERVRVSFVVDKSSDDRLVKVYVNGILSGAQQYPNTDNFTQIVPQNITIGSKECAVLLYNIRVYDNNLTQYQLLNNYIGDMDNIDKKIEVFYRNQLYDAYGNINYARALQYVPCMIIEGKLPEFKGDKRLVNIYYENLQDTSKSYTSTNAQIDVQGTSSQYYPRKNWKIKHKNFTTADGVSDKYKLRDNSIPEKNFTMKADFAESSGVHNTGLAVYYEWAWRQLGFRVSPQDEGYTNGVRTTVDGFPCLIFHRESPDSYLEFTGKYNFNNDKTEATFGFKPGMVSWETRNNTSPRILFESADFESLDINGKPNWLNDYEDRYPDDGYDNPFKLKRLTEWIISCTDDPVKFANEVNDYFDVNSLLFYYVMTEVTAGIDQRGKNMFLTWYGTDEEGLDKCYLIFYDNDTVLGINNEGAMSFDYGVEYHDKIGTGAGASNVWNAESSVLWDLVERGLSEQINDLYARMRAENIISYERFRYFLDDNHSSKWSESIYNEDGMFKYINPLLEDGNGAYLYALQGSREEHRKWWLYNRILYMDSKYTTATHLSDYAVMRLYTPPSWQGVAPNPDFTLTALGDTYARVKFGSYIIKKRIKGNTTVEIKAPADMVFNDTETIVYGAKALTSIGDLSGKYVGTLDTSKAPNLTELIVGSTVNGYKNQNLTALTVGNNNLLTKLNIANCSNLTQSVDLKGCPSIREIEATGSRITSVDLPDGGNLSYLSLPGVASMAIRRQQKLTNENIKLDNYGNLTTLIIENCPLINPFDIIDKSKNLNRVRLIGLDGSSNNASVFNVLEKLKGVDIDGNTTPVSYIEGKWHLDSISKTDFNRYKALWLDFNLTADEFTLSAKMTFNKTIGFTNEISVIPSKSFIFKVDYGENRQNYNLVDGVLTTITAPDIEYSNTTINMIDADKLISLGDLSSKYLGSFDISETPNFKEVIIGSNNSGYSNEYFSELNLGENNTALEVLNIANCPNFEQALDLSITPNIKTLVASGTKIKSLKIKNNSNLTTVTVSTLESLSVENSRGVNVINILENNPLIDKLRWIGVDATENLDKWILLADSNIQGMNADGTICPLRDAIAGKLFIDTIDGEYFDKLLNAFPSLTVTYNKIIAPPFEFADPEVGRVLYVNGLIADPVKSSIEELSTITSLSDYFKSNKVIRQFPELKYCTGITSLYQTFMGCSNLTKAPVIPSSVTNLEYTFAYCSSLTTAPVIPSNVTNLEYTFQGCTNLTTAPVISSSVTSLSNTFRGCSSLAKAPVIPSSVTNLEYTFYGCSSLTTAPDIPVGVTNLSWTFAYCSSLTSAPDIPSSVTNLEYTFQGCSNLTKAPVIPSSVTNLSATFQGCTNLTTAPVIPSSVTNLEYIFQGCSSLTSAPDIPEGITNLEYTFEGCSSLTTAPVIPSSVTSLSNTFEGCSSLTTAPDIPSSVTNLYRTFNSCSSLTEPPVIPSSVTSLSDTFQGCTSLIEPPVIPEGVTSLSGTFRECSNLTKAPVIPSSVTSLSATFRECSSLTKAPVIPEGVTSLSNTFYGCSSLTTAPDIPSSVTSLSATFYGCTNLTTAPVILEGVTDLSWTFGGCSSLTTAPVIPSSVTNLSGTFGGCSSLTAAPDIPEGVTSLEYTFQGCSSLTTTPDIPEGVTNLSNTFEGCSSLTSAPVIPVGVTNLYSAFEGCSSLTTAPVIPVGVINLSSAFYGCSSLTAAPDIPSSVTDLSWTFGYCSRIDGIYIINAVTPVSYSNSLSNVQAIYVPDASVSAYKTASGWTRFENKIFPMSDKPQN